MGLKEIGAEMRRYAIENPRLSAGAEIAPYRRTLRNGLRVVLFVGVDHVWRLSAYRLGVYPSRKEIEILKRDFGIPDEAKEQYVDVPGNAPVEQQWRIIRLTWLETEQRPLFEVGPAEPGPKYF